MWLVQYVFSISVFSEYWCSTVMFSLLRDLDLGNLFIYLFYFYDSGDEYQATRESFPILYVIPSYTDKLCEDFESARDWTVLIHLLIYINTYEKLCEMGRILYLDLSVEEVRPFLDKMLIPLSSSLLFSFLYIVSLVNL